MQQELTVICLQPEWRGTAISWILVLQSLISFMFVSSNSFLGIIYIYVYVYIFDAIVVMQISNYVLVEVPMH